VTMLAAVPGLTSVKAAAIGHLESDWRNDVLKKFAAAIRKSGKGGHAERLVMSHSSRQIVSVKINYLVLVVGMRGRSGIVLRSTRIASSVSALMRTHL